MPTAVASLRSARPKPISARSRSSSEASMARSRRAWATRAGQRHAWTINDRASFGIGLLLGRYFAALPLATPETVRYNSPKLYCYTPRTVEGFMDALFRNPPVAATRVGLVMAAVRSRID